MWCGLPCVYDVSKTDWIKVVELTFFRPVLLVNIRHRKKMWILKKDGTNNDKLDRNVIMVKLH